jgi:hypothetical protein
MNTPELIAEDAHARPGIDRRLLLIGIAFSIAAGGPRSALRAASPDDAALSRAVGVLTHEKSAAEQYAVILATAGKNDTALYVRGIQL